MHEDFFVLWRDGDGGPQRSWLRRRIVTLVIGAALLGASVAALQSTIADDARFEFGTTREYVGVLVGEPVPLLVTTGQVYFLVNPLKYGFDAEARARFAGQPVRLEATLVERGEQRMLEVVEGSLGPAEGVDVPLPVLVRGRGEVVVEGEIVDSKCYLGVMNPGHLKPHRACAINCLRGGIPPVLITSEGRQYVLVASDGLRLQDWILDYVAEPVRVKGSPAALGLVDILLIDSESVMRSR